MAQSPQATLPFARGTVWTDARETADDTVATFLEGTEYWVDDSVNGTGLPVRLRCCRNDSGGSLIARRLVSFDPVQPGTVLGYADVNPEFCRPVDDAYGSKTVPDNDLFYVVVEGPCQVKSALSNYARDIVPGDFLVNITAATSGATTSGRFTFAVTSGATEPLASQLLYRFGVAASTALTNSTNGNFLVLVGKW